MPTATPKVEPRRWLRGFVGLAALIAITWWASGQREMFARVGPAVLLLSGLTAMMIHTLNAVILTTISNTYSGRLTLRDALHLSALGALGNAIGGLPLGTSLKFFLLYKRGGLRITQITAGMMLFALESALFLLLFASLSAWLLENAPLPPAIPAGLLVCALLTLLVAHRLVARWKQAHQTLRPWLTTRKLWTTLTISGAVSVMFILNYVIIGQFLLPQSELARLVLLASVGIIVSMGSILQTVGGVHELSLGAAALASGLPALDGVTLALVMRLTALLSAATILAALYLPRIRNISR